MKILLLLAALLAAGPGFAAVGSDIDLSGSPRPVETAMDLEPEIWNLRWQFTNVRQQHRGFRAPYDGPNSLPSAREHRETNDLTMFLGFRPWKDGEIYFNPEVDQGFGIGNTLGMAGYSSGNAYKVGTPYPYLRVHRLYYRHTFNLGGETEALDSAPNQVKGSRTKNNLIITAGKFSAVDMFDTNTYAHDPRADFLNWSVIDAGAFDFAADAWGFTTGIAAEWNQNWWTLRGGFFNLSKVPNSKFLQSDFKQHSLVTEVETRFQMLGEDGKFKVLAYVNRGRMGRYSDAVRLGQQLGGAPDTADVRRFNSKAGLALNLEQDLGDNLGFFARASVSDGTKEAYEFTEINRSVSAGFLLKGTAWGRAEDRVGVAAVSNGLSGPGRTYFNAGGLGILIGDGQLPAYSAEKIGEVFYSLRLHRTFAVTLDFQRAVNPAYNKERGPVNILGLRSHFDF